MANGEEAVEGDEEEISTQTHTRAVISELINYILQKKC